VLSLNGKPLETTCLKQRKVNILHFSDRVQCGNFTKPKRRKQNEKIYRKRVQM
jgi:hypothetical protein